MEKKERKRGEFQQPQHTQGNKEVISKVELLADNPRGQEKRKNRKTWKSLQRESGGF